MNCNAGGDYEVKFNFQHMLFFKFYFFCLFSIFLTSILQNLTDFLCRLNQLEDGEEEKHDEVISQKWVFLNTLVFV